ncbi:MAG: phosphoribosyltransferase [Dehalococcoidia bacterium]
MTTDSKVEASADAADPAPEDPAPEDPAPEGVVSEGAVPEGLVPEGLEVLWSTEDVRRGIEAIAGEVDAAFRDAPAVNLVPVLTGGLHTAAALSQALERRSPGKWVVAPVFASAYAGDAELGAATAIDFPPGFDGRLAPGMPTLVVDDLLDSGATMSVLLAALRARGLADVRLCVLIERVRERETPLHPDFCAFHLEGDEWLIGFGMDSGGRLRGLDGVYIRRA